MRTRAVLFNVILLGLLAACGPSEPETVVETIVHTRVVREDVPVTVEVTVEVPVTVRVEVTRRSEVTRIVMVTPTHTVTPVHTPTSSSTPTVTHTPTETATPSPSSAPSITPIPTWTPNHAQTATTEALGAMTAPRGNGFYLVGVNIAPGKWESSASWDDCYWVRYDSAQDILDNHYGYAGGTVTIRSTDHQVEFDDCGTWYYVEGAQRPLAADAADPKGNGFYTVGVEIVPGYWKSTGTADDCYWARLDAYQDILDNYYGMSGGTVLVAASDYEVLFEDCGTWEYLGPCEVGRRRKRRIALHTQRPFA